MTSSPSLSAQAATSNSPAAFLNAIAQQQVPGSITGNVASPGAASQQYHQPLAGLTPGGSSPSGVFSGRQASYPTPQYAGTPVAQHALLAQALKQQQVESRQPQRQGGSVAGSGIAHSAVGITSADAPNEVRRLVRALLDGQGQGRLSLARIANEVNGLIQDVNNAFTTVPSVNPAARLSDLLACLDELQVQLARTGLGALPVTGEGVDYSNIHAMIANLSQEVQGKFKHRQRIREGAGVAKSVFK